MKTYEGMFVLDAALAADWPAAEGEVNRILGRSEAKVLGLKNWEERRLAYPFGQHRRGLYVLSYFEAGADKIGEIERDAQLSEKVLRLLVIRREKYTPEDVEKALAAPPPPKQIGRGEEGRGGEGRGGEGRGGEGRGEGGERGRFRRRPEGREGFGRHGPEPRSREDRAPQNEQNESPSVERPAEGKSE